MSYTQYTLLSSNKIVVIQLKGNRKGHRKTCRKSSSQLLRQSQTSLSRLIDPHFEERSQFLSVRSYQLDLKLIHYCFNNLESSPINLTPEDQFLRAKITIKAKRPNHEANCQISYTFFYIN